MKALTNFDGLLKTRKALWIVLGAILAFNTMLYVVSNFNSFSDTQSRKDATGFKAEYAGQFIYFYFYKGFFPLGTLSKNMEYSCEGAEREIQENGEDLIMEYGHWSRLGEHARIFTFLPNAWLNGSPKNPSIKLINTLVFVTGLIILFVGFWRVNLASAGLLLVWLLSFTPFFRYEVYSNENIFYLPGTIFFMTLGLNIFILFSAKISYKRAVLISIISGLIIGFFSEVRNEVSVVLLSLMLLYLGSSNLKQLPRLGIILLIFLSFYGSKRLIRKYFDYKFEQTAELVKEKNGHVYTGSRIEGHKIWHPIFCGLGDFDTKYGYEWNDRLAYRYAVPILNEEYGLDIAYSGRLYTDNYYDSDSLYYVKFDEIGAYEEVVKEKVLTDIFNDPLWYSGIIIRRLVRTLSVTIPLPYIGWLIIPLLFYLMSRRKWDYLKLIVIGLPLSLTPVLIYSGQGSTYNSVFVYMVLAVIFSLWLEKQRAIS